ncbi:hypothetical protein SV7mr_47530 [Stieleria bergensis]|uniref:Planctomycete cytochrome C n=1 Tax=Stieleria bergensis TaxID=2528025 RepID=A0A517T1G2_9BACT|nr:hypothetical protein SV7mr_47530 [Planctomycetes bacterium SV_7m_r]
MQTSLCRLVVVCLSWFHPPVVRCGWLLLLTLSFAPHVIQAGEPDDEPRAVIGTFLRTYCLDCHNDDDAEAKRNFQSYQLPLNTQQQLIDTDEIIAQLTLGQMPPEDAELPTDDQSLQIIDLLRAEIAAARERFDSTGGRTVLRRLSNREYENTIASLFGRRVDTLGLTADFPSDNTSEHFDNIGDALVTSGFLLDQYFQAADRLVETRLAKPGMEPKDWHFTENFQQYEELAGAHRNFFKLKFLAIYEQPNTDTRQGGYAHIQDFLEGVPVSGNYEIKVHAQAMHRDTHYDPKIFRIDFSEPFQIAVVPGDASKGHIHYPQAIEPILASAVVPDDEPQWLSFQVWLEAGQTPRFIFPNGPYESRASVIAVNKRYKDEFDPKTYRAGVSRAHILREGALPHIKIGEVKVRGPLPEPNGSAEEIAVFGPQGFQADQAIKQLNRFASRAFRRPLNDADQKRIETLYQKRLQEGASPRQSALDTVKLILCSPSFLYFSEITDEKQERLNAFDLASRLSYALWSAPPDEQLMGKAQSGELVKPGVLKAEIQRMLKERRSEEFVVGFLESWLNLREIGNQPPPRKSAWQYYSKNLPQSMKQELRLFFADLLNENGSSMRLLDADYTFVDKYLAELYELPEKDSLRLADGFQRVSLEKSRQRGGVLGMAGVLTVSANGVETSPVTRGVWVSENLLGMTPPTPPDDVPSIEANVSGAKTIREKLALHSTDKTCFSCHRKIDPLGYGLESFDPIGRWRTTYPKAQGNAKIDPSGKFPSGESYTDFVGFKNVMSESRQELFARNLIEKLLTYSTGRHMERVDQFAIDDLLKKAKADDYALRTMLVDVLTSEIFLSP